MERLTIENTLLSGSDGIFKFVGLKLPMIISRENKFDSFSVKTMLP